MEKAVVCLVRNEAQAENVINELKQAGFSGERISVLFPDRNLTKDFAVEKHTKAPEGAAAGAGTGGLLGGVFGALVGLGTLAIPGLGLLVAAGPLVAALSGAAVGGAVGGLVGALVGLGIPEYEAKKYEEQVKAGNILITCHTDNVSEREKVEDILENCGAEEISSMTEAHM